MNSSRHRYLNALSLPCVETRGRQQPAWQLLPVVIAAGLILRLFVAIYSHWIGHPDEIFQYLEQAHRLVYGYGFVPWEYRFGTRNWLLPGILAAPLFAFRSLGLDQPSVYVPAIKCLCALLSVTAVYSCYVIGRNLFDEGTARLAAVFSAFWFELIRASVLATPEVMGAYALLGALALLTKEPSTYRAVALGLLIGASVVLRVQYAVPAGILWLMAVASWGRWRAAGIALSGTVALATAAVVDTLTWGMPLISYWNTVVFNVVHGVSRLFGKDPFYQYLVWMFGASAGLHLLAVAYGVLRWRRTWPILLLIASILVPHSIIAHKEYRFVFAAVPLLLVLLAYGVGRVGGYVGSAALARSLALGLFVIVSAVKAASWQVLFRDDRLLASLYLSQQTDVRAVLDLSRVWIHTGGFYYLHHDVPFLFSRNVSSIPAKDIRKYVSHVIATAGSRRPPGFSVERRFGQVELLKNTAPPESWRDTPSDGREPKQRGVDDKFEPTMQRRL